jgi:hypothetical protein
LGGEGIIWGLKIFPIQVVQKNDNINQRPSWIIHGSHHLIIKTNGSIPNSPWVSIPGWWLSHPSEKYYSVGMMRFTIYGKIKAIFQTTNQILVAKMI